MGLLLGLFFVFGLISMIVDAIKGNLDWVDFFVMLGVLFVIFFIFLII